MAHRAQIIQHPSARSPHNQRKVRSLRHVRRDRGYRFTDRDPQMIELCEIITDSGHDITEICNLVAKSSSNQYKVAYTTVANWLSGKTRKPSNFTLMWVGYALGYERRWTKIGK